ncbi:MAG: protein kinase family protein, partial [Flavobacterium sp.]
MYTCSPVKLTLAENEPNKKTSFTYTPPEDIIIVKALNKAKFPVYLGYSNSREEYYAIKVFPYDSVSESACFLNEIAFSGLEHRNIVSILGYETDRQAIFNDKHTHISYTIMELAPHGDFFDFVSSKKVVFDEKLARTFFHQLIDGISYLHSKGIYH